MPTTQLSLNGCPSIPWEFTPKGAAPTSDHVGLFTQLSILGTPGKIHVFLPKGGITPPVDEVECNIYFDLNCNNSLGGNILLVNLPTKDAIWNYHRQEGTIDRPTFNRQLNFLRNEITFYRGFIMANQDPFEISKGGKLVDQRLFLDPLRIRGDEVTGTPTSTQSETGFIVDNILVNSVPVLNEDGITFPEGTVIQFDCEAPGSLGEELAFDEALLYFNFTSNAGLRITISHPIRVVDAIEVR